MGPGGASRRAVRCPLSAPRGRHPGRERSGSRRHADADPGSDPGGCPAVPDAARPLRTGGADGLHLRQDRPIAAPGMSAGFTKGEAACRWRYGALLVMARTSGVSILGTPLGEKRNDSKNAGGRMKHSGFRVLATLVVLALGVVATSGVAHAGMPVVKTVPWLATNPLIPHDTWSGKSITLKGTSDQQAANFEWTWDFGDGTPVATGTVTNRYAIE